MKKKTKAIVKSVKPSNVGLSLAKELKDFSNVEDLGTSMYHTSQQFYLIIQDLLRREFNFEEKDLSRLNREVIKGIEGLDWFEEKGLNPLSVDAVGQLVNVTLNHYQQFKAAKAGISLPVAKEARKLLES